MLRNEASRNRKRVALAVMTPTQDWISEHKLVSKPLESHVLGELETYILLGRLGSGL
jgi:hypothetical protein